MCCPANRTSAVGGRTCRILVLDKLHPGRWQGDACLDIASGRVAQPGWPEDTTPSAQSRVECYVPVLHITWERPPAPGGCLCGETGGAYNSCCWAARAQRRECNCSATWTEQPSALLGCAHVGESQRLHAVTQHSASPAAMGGCCPSSSLHGPASEWTRCRSPSQQSSLAICTVSINHAPGMFAGWQSVLAQIRSCGAAQPGLWAWKPAWDGRVRVPAGAASPRRKKTSRTALQSRTNNIDLSELCPSACWMPSAHAASLRCHASG